MGSELISVVMPIYNQERFLKKSLRDVMGQSYSNIEIVAVNDGSTDDSLKILRQFSEKDKRIVIVNKENGGLVDAVAEGIRHSHGELIAFVDPDDSVGKNFLKDLRGILGNDCDVAAAGIYTAEVGDYGEISRGVFCLDDDRIYEAADLKEEFFWNKKKAHLMYPILQSRCNKLYRKTILDKIVDEYALGKDAVIGEDSIFNYLVLGYANRISAQRAPVEYCYYLRTDASMTRSVAFKKRYRKNVATFNTFKGILGRHDSKLDMAYELFYVQTQGVMYQASYCSEEYKELQLLIRKDIEYKKAYDIIICNAIGVSKINMIRKAINELKLPIVIAWGLRRIRNYLGRIRHTIGRG